MTMDDNIFPDRDERLGRALADATSPRERSDAQYASLRGRIVGAAQLPLARRRRSWWAPFMERAPGLAAAAAVVLLILGSIVYATPRADTSFADLSAELIELLGEEEVQSFFPGANDPERLLEAAFAAQ